MPWARLTGWEFPGPYTARHHQLSHLLRCVRGSDGRAPALHGGRARAMPVTLPWHAPSHAGCRRSSDREPRRFGLSELSRPTGSCSHTTPALTKRLAPRTLDTNSNHLYHKPGSPASQARFGDTDFGP